MRIFDFTLMNGYEFSGVDVAQGFRAKLFKKNNIDIKYCFMNLPTQRDLDLYINQGIDREQIISKEIYLTGRMDMRLSLVVQVEYIRINTHISMGIPLIYWMMQIQTMRRVNQ